MTVGTLTVRGASDTRNVLLLNYFGTAVPLTVLNGFTLADDGRIQNFNSGFVVQGGTITVTNTQMSQDGGLVQTTNSTMYLYSSQYQLTNGIFEGGHVWLGSPSGPSVFNQYGGSAQIADLAFLTAPSQSGPGSGGGSYALYGGYLSLPGGLDVRGENGATTSYFQSGGTNQTTLVHIEAGLFGRSPSFTLNGGLLADDNMELRGDGFGGAVTLNQNGGAHLITDTLSIAGGSSHGTTIFPATYNLNSGTLSAGAIELNANGGDAVFLQSNATTTAQTIYAHSIGYYGADNSRITLAGGSLSCSNFTTIDGGGTFNQTGGALVVSNLLEYGGSRDWWAGFAIYGTYTLTAGTVSAKDISITGDWIIGDSSTSRITNPGTFSLSHLLLHGAQFLYSHSIFYAHTDRHFCSHPSTRQKTTLERD
jgi:hypothetical protein